MNKFCDAIQGIADCDKSGNMTIMLGQKNKYDAWNRMD